MTVRLELVDARDAARIVDALLAQALVECRGRPMISARYIELANRLGDAMATPGLPAHAPSLDPLDPAYVDPCDPATSQLDAGPQGGVKVSATPANIARIKARSSAG